VGSLTAHNPVDFLTFYLPVLGFLLPSRSNGERLLDRAQYRAVLHPTLIPDAAIFFEGRLVQSQRYVVFFLYIHIRYSIHHFLKCCVRYVAHPNYINIKHVKQIVYVFYTSNKAASQIGKQC
jgi:hypothetical protein